MNNILMMLLTPAFGYAILRVTTPILFAAIGNVISSRAGVANIAMEGTMLSASLTGVIVSAYTHSALLGFLAAVVVGVLFSSIMAYISLYLGTNVIMAGIALNLFASKFTVYILYMLTGQKGNSASLPSKQLPSIDIPIIEKIPVIGKIVSGQNVLVYVAFLSVIVAYVLLKYTKLGAHIKAVGENPSAAASVGIHVKRVQFIALCISGILAGCGGAFMSMGYLSMFTRDMVAGRGWIAIAASAMGRSLVIPTTITSFLFGIFAAIGNVLQLENIPTELITILPYAAVFVGMVVYSMRKSKKEAV